MGEEESCSCSGCFLFLAWAIEEGGVEGDGRG